MCVIAVLMLLYRKEILLKLLSRYPLWQQLMFARKCHRRGRASILSICSAYRSSDVLQPFCALSQHVHCTNTPLPERAKDISVN